MSDLMDAAVINMPYELAMSDDLSRKQFYSRSQAVLKERDEALAKLAAMESQEPVAVMGNNGSVKAKHEFSDIDSFLLACRSNTALFSKPVPANKPAAAVPDGWKLVPVEPTPEMESTFNDWMGMEGNFRQGYDGLLYAAPSHSQQSNAVDLLRQIFELYEDGVDCYENPDEGAGYLGKAFRIDDDTFKLCVALLDSYEERCPSHESEQGGESTN